MHNILHKSVVEGSLRFGSVLHSVDHLWENNLSLLPNAPLTNGILLSPLSHMEKDEFEFGDIVKI